MTHHRAWGILWLQLWLAGLAALSPALAGEGYAIGGVPDWVVPIDYPTGRIGDQTRIRRGIHYLLADLQLRGGGGERQAFIHSAYKIANRAGLDDWSDISINFDPSYERVSLIAVSIIRNGRKVDQLKTARLDVFQRERRLEYQSYNGEQTLHLLLQDVRVGDIVEYSYLISGENPALRGRYFAYLDFQWSLPVDRVYRRVDWQEPGRTLQIREIGKVGDPVATSSGGRQILVWDRSNLESVIEDPDQPAWYEGYAGVEVSDARSWAEIAGHASRLFEGAVEATPALKEVAAQIRKEHALREEQTVAALRFVQDAIRYVAISVGPGGYVPNPASVTLQRRYGDCKDKTALLVTLLRLLDIDADAVLVNTETGRQLHARLPSLQLFDHMMAVARINGSVYWLDATRSDQQGDLAHVFQPDYGDGLVLSERSDNLTKMAHGSPDAPTTSTYLDLDLSQGPQKPGTLTVKTVFSGADADQIRQRLSTRSLPELQRDYLDYYARYYADIRAVAEPAVEREDAMNRVTVIERYELTQPWKKQNNVWRATYEVGALRSRFDRLGATDRSSPLKLRYPVNDEELLTLHRPSSHKDWEDGKTTEHVADAVMAFDYESETVGAVTTFHYVYRTLKDHVPVSDLAKYKADLDRALDFTGNYSIELGAEPKPSRAHRNGWVWVIAAVAIWFVVVFVVRLTKARRKILAHRLNVYRIHLDKDLRVP